MNIEELLIQQRTALKAGHTEEALRLLDMIEAEVEKATAWDWLTSNKPGSYDELIAKLEQASAGLAPSGQTELGHLIRVFRWCEEHAISLDQLQVENHLSKYREASSKLNQIIGQGDEVKEELLAALDAIQSHRTRAETRAWAR